MCMGVALGGLEGGTDRKSDSVVGVRVVITGTAETLCDLRSRGRDVPGWRVCGPIAGGDIDLLKALNGRATGSSAFLGTLIGF